MMTRKIVISPGVEIAVVENEWMPKDMVVITGQNGAWAIKGNKERFFTTAELQQMYRNALRELGFYADD